jgi:hypothetical protein
LKDLGMGPFEVGEVQLLVVEAAVAAAAVSRYRFVRAVNIEVRLGVGCLLETASLHFLCLVVLIDGPSTH